MNFGQYYRSQYRPIDNPQARLDVTRRRILNRIANKATQAECNKLGEYFTDIFYPKKEADSNSLFNKVVKEVQDDYQKKWNNINESLITIDSASPANVNNVVKMLREKSGFGRTVQVKLSTIKNQLNQIEKTLKKVSKQTSLEDFETWSKDLEILNNYFQTFFSQYTSINNVSLDLRDDKDLMYMVNRVEALYSAAKVGFGTMSPEESGEFLEYVLEAFSNEMKESTNITTNELIKKLIAGTAKTAGTTRNAGGEVNSLISVALKDLEFDNSKTVQIEDKEITVSAGDSEDQKVTFKYVQGFKSDDTRYGKMDVDFTFKDGENLIPFRISAKNWDSFDRDLGSVSLIYAIIRSVGDASTLGYIYSMQDEWGSDSLKKGYHNLAKYAVFADIVMGLSQQQGYADTLLINNRSQQKIVVISLMDLMQKIFDKVESEKVSSPEVYGYNDALFETKLAIIRRAAEREKKSGEGRSEFYNTMALKYLQSISVMIRFNSITYALSS